MSKKYTATIQFGGSIMCSIQTDDNGIQVSGAVNGWGHDMMPEVQIQVTKNEKEEGNE